MEIIKRTEGLTAKDLYNMTKGSSVRKMSDAKGETLDVLHYIVYKDTNSETAEVSIVLSMMTTSGGIYATNSKTFIRNFLDILAMYEDTGEEAPTKFAVNSARSRNGREFLVCDLA